MPSAPGDDIVWIDGEPVIQRDGWLLLNDDEVTGIETWVRSNPDGTVTIRKYQDVEPILDRAKAQANDGDGWADDKSMRRLMTIPDAVLEEYRAKGVNLLHPDYADELKKLANNIDYRDLRTAHWRA